MDTSPELQRFLVAPGLKKTTLKMMDLNGIMFTIMALKWFTFCPTTFLFRTEKTLTDCTKHFKEIEGLLGLEVSGLELKLFSEFPTSNPWH